MHEAHGLKVLPENMFFTGERGKKRGFLFLCGCLLLAGCGINSSSFVLYDLPAKYQRFLYQPSAQAELLYESKRPYVELAHISARGKWYDDYDRVNELLREQAAALGADAVIHVEYDTHRVIGLSAIFISFGCSVASGQGIAVKFLDQ